MDHNTGLPVRGNYPFGLDRNCGGIQTLKQDLSAMEAAVSEPWSNGPVEGQLNRLKLLKRQMYGRAGIELLALAYYPSPRLASRNIAPKLLQNP
jgi:hypothetical protein